MNELLSPLVLATYYGILGVLALYGAHRFYLLALYYRTRNQAFERPPTPASWPRVTVQLPLYNEMYVATRLIDAVCRLDYPRECLEVQVLDDSTDETRAIVAESVARWQTAGVDIVHLHRTDRVGFKAGALAAGLECAKSDLLAVFDADFVPKPSFLKETVPYFADTGIGMVQGCWDHINRDYSLITRIQSIFLDGHFLIEHAARNRSGRFFNFNGTAGVWRKAAILDAGGWQHDTLTEDLDLSYRAQLEGWRFLFLPEVKAPAELPVEIKAFKRQQFRWAKGSIQTARKLLPRILTARLSPAIKLEAFVHLTNNAAYVLMVGLSLLVFPAMVLRRGSELSKILTLDLPMFLCATVSFLAFYLASQVARGGSWRREILRLPPLMGVGIGLAINNSRAVLAGLGRTVGVFERTPKYRIETGKDSWRSKKYRVAFSSSDLAEGLFALYFAAVFFTAWHWGMWLSLPFLYLFLQGYSYMFLLSLGSAAPSRVPLAGGDGSELAARQR